MHRIHEIIGKVTAKYAKVSLILCGDLNTAPKTNELQVLTNVFRLKYANNTSNYTFRNNKSIGCIDYILHHAMDVLNHDQENKFQHNSKIMTLDDMKIMEGDGKAYPNETWPSDHCLLYATFRLKTEWFQLAALNHGLQDHAYVSMSVIRTTKQRYGFSSPLIVTHLQQSKTLFAIYNARKNEWNYDDNVRLKNQPRQLFHMVDKVHKSADIYVPNIEYIVCIGGYKLDEYNGSKCAFGVHAYSLKTCRWEMLYDGSCFGLNSVSAVLTQDGRNIVIMNGFDIDCRPSRDIFVLCLPQNTDGGLISLHRSYIKTPKPGTYHVVHTRSDIMKDKLICFGFIRHETNEYNIMVLPYHAKRIVLRYCAVPEMIHWVNKCDHLAINVRDVVRYTLR
eukprot:805963_1